MTMPVEIKELVIRAVVQSPSEHPAPATSPHSDPHDRQAIIEAAVREVLRILRAGKER